MPIIDALMASINIPIMFTPYEYNGNLYIDGALGNPYPIDILNEGEQTLGISISSDFEDDCVSYISKLIDLPIRKLIEMSIKYSKPNCKHIILNTRTPGVSIFVSIEDRRSLVTSGYKQMENFINKK